MSDQDEIDMEQFASLLDTALTSDIPAVKNALRNLMTITTIVTAQNPGQELVHGPFRKMVENYKNIDKRLWNIEDRLSNPPDYNYSYDNIYTSSEPIGKISIDVGDISISGYSDYAGAGYIAK